MIRKLPVTVEQELPLSGKRIVITRARAQAGSLAQRIEDLGGQVIEFPTIEIQPPADPRPMEEAIKNLRRYEWLIFTSVNGVERFLEGMARHKIDSNELASVQVAAIGPETAKRLEAAGVTRCLVPTSYRAEGILDVLHPDTMRGKRVLIPRAAKAREVLPETLRQWGAVVDVVEAYRTVTPETDTSRLKDMLRRHEIDMVTFTSSSTVSNFARLFDGRRLADILGDTPVACIGPITKDTVEELGGGAKFVAQEFTVQGLIRVIVDYYSQQASGKDLRE
ncbi:MAG: uroporphyrinogen-III synthase [Deltaproteobacteria bacterium]|nr:uroporphyrinogen-III synthase [Deltaproteobacteria bacterium]